METCAIKLLEQKDAHNLIVCLEEQIDRTRQDFDWALSNCIGYRPQDRDNIFNCANSMQGNQFEHEMAQKTPEDHQYVPYITVDGVHDVQKEDHIMESLLDFLYSLNQ